jgi:flagellar assembly factor FliW
LGIKIKTRRFGEIEIKEQQVIDFPDGVLGFDYVKKFVLLDTQDENSPLKWLQAFDEPELAFIIIRPVDFMREYELVVSMNDIEAVGAKDADVLLVFAIVTIPSNPSEMTANLQGPIIINPEKKLGRQAISLSDRYTVRHRILDEIKKAAEG